MNQDFEWVVNMERRKAIQVKLQGWPEKGDKIIFKGAEFSRFNDHLENAKKLTLGAEYTISEIQVNSSSCFVWLEGFEEEFSLHMFDYTKRELKKEERDKLNEEFWELVGKA